MMPFLDDFPDTLEFTLGEALEPLGRLQDEVLALTVPRAAGAAPPRPRLVGMEPLVRRFLQALIIGEHCLVEGYPGLAKTRSAKALSSALGLNFHRIQFVPDLMPSDLIQRERLILDAEGRPRIEWVAGPVFTNLLLADEINRASPKAQAALLEVSEERHVTPLHRARMIVRPRLPFDETKLLDDFNARLKLLGKPTGYFGERPIEPALPRGQIFVIIATMNPIEQEGVFPLSEAQLDRFCFKLQVRYPSHGDLDEIGEHAFEVGDHEPAPDQDPEELARAHLKALYFFTRLRKLLLGAEARTRWIAAENRTLRAQVADLIDFTHARRARMPDELGDDESPDTADLGSKASELDELIRGRQAHARTNLALARHATELADALGRADQPEVLSGSSPRGLIKLIRAAHAEALLDGFLDMSRKLAAPEWSHVASVAPDVLGHRVRLAPTAMARGMSPRTVINRLVKWVETRP
jgi:MoxR-like ATPase